MVPSNDNPPTQSDRIFSWLRWRDIAMYNDQRNGFMYAPNELLISARDIESNPNLREQLKRLEASRQRGHVPPKSQEMSARDWLHQAVCTLPGQLPQRVDDPPNIPDRRRPSSSEDEQNAALEQLEVTRWYLPPGTDVPATVRALSTAPDGTSLGVSPNHVFSFEAHYMGGPGTVPMPPNGQSGQDLGEPQPPDSKVRVAVLDTGIVKDWKQRQWFKDRIITEGNDDESLDADNDTILDLQAGHGTFIAGVIAAKESRVHIQAERVLDSFGLCTDAELATALLGVKDAPIINLSLGGYTFGDQAPSGVTAALRQLPAETALVAAAGNNNSDRLFWPAALKRVVAVGAHDGGAPKRRAGFSNYGWWVDACADGQDVLSTFVEFSGHHAGVPDQHDFKGFAVWSGTSFAAPLVAACIAARVADGLSPRDAADELVHSGGLERLKDLGTVIDA